VDDDSKSEEIPPRTPAPEWKFIPPWQNNDELIVWQSLPMPVFFAPPRVNAKSLAS